MPRSEAASIRAILREVAQTQPETIRTAINRGIAARPPASFPYLRLAAEYLDGKPTQAVELSGVNGAALFSGLRIEIVQAKDDDANGDGA